MLLHSDSSPAFSMYIHVHEKLLLSYISALEEAGFKWTIFTWVKGEAVKVKHQSYGRSTELILVCSIGDLPRSYTVNMPSTPAARANVAYCNSVPDGAMLTNAQNQVINGAQKPTCIAQMFAHDLTQGGPNSTVLVLGGGSGSEVVGALQNGNSVVVFEKDQVQFRAMQARLEQALGVHTTVLTVIPPDQQPKTLLVEPAEYAWQRGRIRHFDRSLPENSEAEFSSARKAFRALTKKARAEALRQLEEEEVKQEPPEPACYVCGENLGSGEVFCCKRCNARSHEKCQDGDGEHCNACGEVVEAEIIAAMRAEDDARAQAPDSSQGVPVTKPVVEEPPAAV